MREYQIKITRLAEKDLENLGDYIAEQLLNPEAAKKMIQGIRKQVDKLRVFPERYELDRDPVLKAKGIRMTYYRKYKIFYVVDVQDSIVYIVRILHTLANSRAQLYQMFE